MENNQDSVILEEKESMGTVSIADDVVAMIAALAAAEVEGVSALVGNLAGAVKNAVSNKKLAKGVKVEVTDQKVKVDISINIAYGHNIPATCKGVQNKVQSAVETMTGLTVTSVNVIIAGIQMK